jgi:hypothetical protein
MNCNPDLSSNSVLEAAAALSAGHLTADQIDDHLIGDLATAPAAHLAACSLCADRVATIANPIASFQHVATAWSERRSATLPLPVPTQQQPLWQRHMAWASACFTLAVSVSLINASHQFSLQTATPRSAPSLAAEAVSVPQSIAAPKATVLTETASIAPSAHTTQIAADNHMLRAVNAAFDPFAESSAALGLTDSHSNRPPTSIQD